MTDLRDAIELIRSAHNTGWIKMPKKKSVVDPEKARKRINRTRKKLGPAEMRYRQLKGLERARKQRLLEARKKEKLRRAVRRQWRQQQLGMKK